MYRLITCFLLALVLFSGCTAISDGKKLNSNTMSFYWYHLKNIEKFAIVYLETEGSAEKIGIKPDELQDYLFLKFKNSFSGMEFNPDVDLIEPLIKPNYEKALKNGTIIIRIWTVGEDNEVAYLIQLLAGNLIDRKLYKNEVLGFDSKKNMPYIVRNTISDLIDEFAIFFFTNRDEL